MNNRTPVMLIHGAWLNSKSWEHWPSRLEGQGRTVAAPDWPGDEGDPAELRAVPRMELTKYGPKEIVAHYDRYIVPTAGKVCWDGVLSGGAGPINWKNPRRAPLLLVAGGLDKIAEASMTRAIYNKQRLAGSRTELKLYPDRSHFTCIEPGWEEVADHALRWVDEAVDGRPT